MFGFKKAEVHQIESIQDPRRGFWATKKNLGEFVTWARAEFTAAQHRIAGLELKLVSAKEELEVCDEQESVIATLEADVARLEQNARELHAEVRDWKVRCGTREKELYMASAELARWRKDSEDTRLAAEFKQAVAGALADLGIKAGGCKCKK